MPSLLWLRTPNRLREKEQYLGYSELDRLVQATLAHKIPLFQRHLASFVRAHDNRDVVLIPGPFCSELVAKYFEKIGLALFEPPRAPENIAPNDLANSSLRRVNGAILSSSRLESVEFFRDLGHSRKEFLQGKEFLRAMVKFRSQSTHISHQVHLMEETFSRERGETLTMTSAVLVSQLQEAVEKAVNAERNGDHVMAQRLSITAQSFLLALALCNEIVSRRSLPAIAKRTAWQNAEARLLHAVVKLSSEIDREWIRRSAITDIQLARRLCRANESEENKATLLQIRRTVLKGWINKVEMDRQWTSIFSKVEDTLFEDDEVSAIVQDVVTSAFNLVQQSADDSTGASTIK